jgi:outer membrane protein assembly factor BamE (lipoprotein component of BamABCDE complex)
MKCLKIFAATFLILFAFGIIFSSPCIAQEDEVIKLRQKITELENRIKEMEITLVKYQEKEKTQDQSGYAWQNRKNWRKLETGMSRDEVRSLLGEPIKTVEGVKTLWYYPDIYRGYVSFDDKGLLIGWLEP